MKKILGITASILLLAAAFACFTATPSEAKTTRLRLATHYNTNHPGYASLQRIVKEIETKTKGDLKIKIYPSSQLGDYTVTYQDLMKGAVDMALIPIPSEYDSKLEMNFIPYLVAGYQDLPKVFGPQSYFSKTYGQVHDKLGVKLMGIYVEGLIGIAYTKLPAKYQDAAAKKASKVRAPAIEVYNLVVNDMGFGATTIPYSDLYSSLQTGVCDGAIGLTPQLAYSDFRDVIKHYVCYNIFAENIGYFTSKKTFGKLTQEQQKIVTDAFRKEADNSYKVAKSLDEKAINDLKKYGVKVETLSAKEMKAYVDKVRKVTWPKLKKNIGADTLKKLTESVK